MSPCQSGLDILLLHGEVDQAELGPEVTPDPVPHPPERQTAGHRPVSTQSVPLTLYVLTQSIHIPVYCSPVTLPHLAIIQKSFPSSVTFRADLLSLLPPVPHQWSLSVCGHGGVGSVRVYEGVPQLPETVNVIVDPAVVPGH